jgi:nucleoside-triphosphatase
MTTMPEERQGALILLTGARGAGKTNLCREAVQWARERGWLVAGLLSPARFEGTLKVGIDVVDLRTDEMRPLAQLRSRTRGPVGTHTQRWAFDDDAMAWANRTLQQAVPCDLLIVDELGPLELERGEGWTAGLVAIESRRYRQALVVIRPELVPIALSRWSHAVVTTVEENRSAVAREELQRLLT